MFVGVELRQLTDLARVLRSHLGRLVPDDVPLSEAPEIWDTYDEIERCTVAAKTLLAARVEESRTWARAGDRSAAEYMARKAGSSVGAARNCLETSKRLRRLPATEAAVRRGELSRAQAEAIADAAAVNPAAEQSLLDAAPRSTVVDLRQQANRAKAAGDPEPSATHRRIHRQRRLRRFTDGEGAWNLQGRGTPNAAVCSTPRSTRSSTSSSALLEARVAGSPVRPTPSTRSLSSPAAVAAARATPAQRSQRPTRCRRSVRR
jgi:Domain of unknown function (DUF222)